jgi:hypothetical protein
MTSSATSPSAGIVQNVWRRACAVRRSSRTPAAAACFATISPTAPGDSASAGAERRCNKLTNNASVAAAGRLADHRRSASCASACSGTVRVRPRLAPRTTISSRVWAPRRGATAVRRRASGCRPRSRMSVSSSRATSARRSPARASSSNTAVAGADPRAAIRASQQVRELEVRQRVRPVALGLGAADAPHKDVAAKRGREPAHSADALRDRCRREPPGDELVAPRRDGLNGGRLPGGLAVARAQERRKRAVSGRVRPPRVRRRRGRGDRQRLLLEGLEQVTPSHGRRRLPHPTPADLVHALNIERHHSLFCPVLSSAAISAARWASSNGR